MQLTIGTQSFGRFKILDHSLIPGGVLFYFAPETMCTIIISPLDAHMHSTLIKVTLGGHCGAY